METVAKRSEGCFKCLSVELLRKMWKVEVLRAVAGVVKRSRHQLTGA